MVTAQARPLTRFSLVASVGLAIAFAGVLLSIFFGGSATQAHADDGDKGLLGGVTDLVDDVVSGTTDAATSVVSTTVQTVVKPVTQKAEEAVVTVVPPAAPVVRAVEHTAAAVTAPVQKALSSAPVSAVVDPVLSAVTNVPVVGDAVDGLGVDTAVRDVVATVEGALVSAGSLGETITEAVTPATPPAIELPSGELPPASVLPISDDAARSADIRLTSTVTAERSAIALVARPAASPAVIPVDALAGVAAVVSAAAFIAADAATPSLSPGLFVPVGGISSSPAGAGFGAMALAVFGLLVAHRAWVRRRGWEYDAAPPAPAYSTDVAPD